MKFGAISLKIDILINAVYSVENIRVSSVMKLYVILGKNMRYYMNWLTGRTAF